MANGHTDPAAPQPQKNAPTALNRLLTFLLPHIIFGFIFFCIGLAIANLDRVTLHVVTATIVAVGAGSRLVSSGCAPNAILHGAVLPAAWKDTSTYVAALVAAVGAELVVMCLFFPVAGGFSLG